MLKDLLTRIDALRAKLVEAWQILDITKKEEDVKALEVQTMITDFWSDQERARKISQQLADMKKEIENWIALRVDVAELHELVLMSEGEADETFEKDAVTRMDEMEKRYQSMEFSMLMHGPHDLSNVVMAIHAGAGGTDAQDWAEMLMRMYFRFAENKGWKVRLVDESRGTEAGIKSATFFIEGRYAYGYLRGEAGVHRLVRQSPFNSDALRQTSFALVEVLPEIDENIDVEIKADDLRIDTFMSGGKGGQSVNTTYSAVRIVHLPTKITVTCQNERSQTQNRETAMMILKSKLMKLKEDELAKEKQELRGEFHSAEWGSQIRSYVLHPYKMVKDHRTDAEVSDPDAVLNGGLDLFIEAELRMEAAKK